MMRFEWDGEKNRLNVEKHGIDFELAAQIFSGPVLSVADKRTDYGEVRMLSIGRAGLESVVAVVHTDRDGVTRLISARKANRKERRRYEQALQETPQG